MAVQIFIPPFVAGIIYIYKKVKGERESYNDCLLDVLELIGI